MENKSELGQYIPLHYHYQMLSDRNRMDAFDKAIAEVVLPSHKVVDFGSGTGIMSYHASKKAEKVWAIENNPELVSHSRKFMNENSGTDNIEIIHGDAMEWMPEEPVDVVICEMLHSALLREKQVQVISNFRNKHFEKFMKNPIFLPSATLLGVQPVCQKYDFSGFSASVPLFRDAYSEPDDLVQVCAPRVYRAVDYNNAEVDPIKGDLVFEVENEARLNALRFITKSILSMNLVSGELVDWQNQFLVLPFENEIEVKSGQEIRIRFNYLPGDSIDKLQESIQVDVLSDCNESKGSRRIIEIGPNAVSPKSSNVREVKGLDVVPAK
jgi:protein arginine N-methyltransferase 1